MNRRPLFVIILSELLILAIFLCANNCAFAEKIKFKNGKVIDGKIIEETGDYIKVELEGIEGTPITYFKDEIESIEGKVAKQPETPVFGEHADLKKYKELIQKEPDNYEHYLAVANIYASTGDGDQAVEYAEKAIQLDSKSAINKGAYMTAAMGSYYAGKPRQSYEYVEKALHANPNDKIAKDFKNMLDTAIKQLWGGELPEKVTFGGYSSAVEAGRALMKEGRAILGDKEDRFISETLRFRITGPKGWHKSSDFLTPKGARALMFYTKLKDDPVPMIGITKDDAYPEDKTALDFSKKMKDIFLEQFPNMSFDGPHQITINEKLASRMEFKLAAPKGVLYTEWYQFLHDGTIITFEYTNWEGQFESEHNIFKEVVNSFVIE